MRGVITALVAGVLLVAVSVLAKDLPKPSDAEEHSKVSPEHMKCDTCAASTFHIWWKFKKAHEKHNGRRLRESEVIELVEDACMPRTYATTYGIKDVNGTHHLSGDGLSWFGVQSPTVGTLQPGMWLTDQCRMTVGVFDEDALYTMFRIYHVQMGAKRSDVQMFRHICIKERKQCDQKEGEITYDGYVPEEDNKVVLQDLE